MTDSTQALNSIRVSSRYGGIGTILFLIYYSVFVWSSINVDFQMPDSPLRHVVMVVVAYLSFLYLPAAALASVFIFSPLVIVYLLGELPVYAGMAIVFAAAIPLLSEGMHSIILGKNKKVIVLMLVIALVPAVNGILVNGFDVIYNSDHYGRARLLLGYWHPKEAAACFLAPMFLYLIMRDYSKFHLALLAPPLILWFIGSRNAALAFWLAIAIRYFPVATKRISLILIAGIASIIYFDIVSFDILDQITSLRLSQWSQALVSPGDFVNRDIAYGGGRFGIDSFYIELFICAGIFGVILLGIWLMFLWRILARTNWHNKWSLSALSMIIVFSTFDSGMISTGNLVHVLCWSLVWKPVFGFLHAQIIGMTNQRNSHLATKSS